MYKPMTRVVLFDIETVPADARPDMDLNDPPAYARDATKPPPVEARVCPKNYKKEDTIAAWKYKERMRVTAAEVERQEKWLEDAAAYYAKQSLNPMKGKVCHLGIGIYDFPTSQAECMNPTEVETHIISGDEKDILAKGWEIFKAQPHAALFVAHNGHAFDCPYLQLRAIKHGMMDMAKFFTIGKPWESPFVDTMLKWPATGFGAKRSGRSVDAIMEFLGDEREENPFTGAHVLQAYVSGAAGDADIKAHCLDDLRCLLKIYTITAQIEK